MKDINFSKRTLIIAFSIVILITISVLDFEHPSIEVDGGKYFIIFSAFFGLIVQFLKENKSPKSK
ncbi:MAG: hypothetical protein KAH10_06625 [Flavobacteriales bacterium]|nr:hypothetical protein [Flavobacteriales bacterium]